MSNQTTRYHNGSQNTELSPSSTEQMDSGTLPSNTTNPKDLAAFRVTWRAIVLRSHWPVELYNGMIPIRELCHLSGC